MSRYVEYDSLIADSYESDMWDRGNIKRLQSLRYASITADAPQTDIHGLTDCDFCKEKNCEDCEGGKDEPQTVCRV